MNINGATNTASLQAIVHHDDIINAQSTIQLFQPIEAYHSKQHVFTLLVTMRVIIDPN
ncbi:hypothetical protein [Nitrosomonas sp. Nm132]|uniref:hypothetical protein n=1 Tax=Nitrosomonas sp. Nm132 TaxID=1881053 RepID=UPI0015A3061A|nr:hypothetical protein [Nitrosomonas sp. Nm132]